MAKLKPSDLDEYTEEIQEIMGFIPKWIVRWGITTFFFILLAIFIGSYFFKHSAVVSVSFDLTTVNPPAALICKESGRINKWKVSNGQHVQKGTVVAIFDDNIKYKDILAALSFLNKLKSTDLVSQSQISPPQNISLGSIQTNYLALQEAISHLQYYVTQNAIGNRIELTKSRISNLQAEHELLLQQLEIKQKELKITRDKYLIDSLWYFTGGYGVIKQDYDNSLKSYLGQQSAFLSFRASVNSSELSRIVLDQELVELRLSQQNEQKLLQDNVKKALADMENQIQNWLQAHIVKSPIEGSITFTNYWSENQFVKSGERLATVVPEGDKLIIARAYVPAENLGKVDQGQKVNIKLSGFPPQEFGVLSGYISSISMVPEERGYVAEISLDQGMRSSYSENLKFIQEMTGTADIVTQETRLLFRLINPLRSILK